MQHYVLNIQVVSSEWRVAFAVQYPPPLSCTYLQSFSFSPLSVS